MSAVTVLVLGSFADSLINFRGPLLRAMVQHGYRVVACAPAASPDIIAQLERLGVFYRDIPLQRASVRPDHDLRALWALVRLFRELKPHMVLSYTIKPVIYGLLAARLAGVPRRFAMITGLGYSFIGTSFKARLVGQFTRQLYRLSLAGAHRIFFQNPDDKALFQSLSLLGRSAQTVMINGSGVDVAHFPMTPIPDQPPSFLLISRLIVEKGICEYVDAARKVRQRYPDARFHLVGWHDQGNPAAIPKRDLEAWVVDGLIEYHGELSDVRPAIANCAVYVLPSYREGTPRTVLEAMAMGRPIVTTDAPGCRETVVPGRNGFLVPVQDAEALAGAMARFLDQPDLIRSMGAASRKMAEEKYDVHRVNAVILHTMGLAA